jgi:hypothetical protein
MALLNWLDSILFGVRKVYYAATEMPERPAVKFTGAGVSVADDSSAKATVVTIAGSSMPAGEIVQGAEGSVATSGAINALATTGFATINLTSATAVTLNGIANGATGKDLFLVFTATGTIVEQSGSASAGNKIKCGGGVNVPVSGGKLAHLRYHADGFWHLVSVSP